MKLLESFERNIVEITVIVSIVSLVATIGFFAWQMGNQMKLNVSFENLALEASKVKGLIGFAEALRDSSYSYQEAIEALKLFTSQNGGECRQEDEVTRFVVLGETLDCYQPYKDIDKLYFDCQFINFPY